MLYVTERTGIDDKHGDNLDDENEDDDVFEDYNEGTDKYLNFPHEEDETQQRDGCGESYSSVHYSSLDDDSFADESQGASGGTPESADQ